jgi:transposase InsO family protein
MFENDELANWCERNNLTEQARKKIDQIRSADPSRLVQSGQGNVSGRYPSKKMGRTIQFESHRSELPAIIEFEHDLTVLEYYDQPSKTKLEYDGSNGKRIVVLHTPDFFVIRVNSAGWEECKTEEELILLSEQNPNRYYKDEEGNWRCPPGEAYAEQFGFYYRVRTTKDINWTFQRNIQFLEDYLRVDAHPVSDASRSAIFETVSIVPSITLQELYFRVEGVATRDDVHMLIAAEEIFVDLSAAPLPEPGRVHVFSEKEVAIAYSHATETSATSAADNLRFIDLAQTTKVIWDGHVWDVLNAGETMVGLLSDNETFKEVPISVFEELVKRGKITGVPTSSDGPTLHPEARERLFKASKSDLQEANRRTEILLAYRRGESLKDYTVSERTLQRWEAIRREAEAKYSCGFIGLIPQPKPANRRVRLDQATILFLNEFIEKDFESLKQKKKYEVYAAFLRACEKDAVIPASYKTFCRAIKHRSRYEQVLKRQGRRAAYLHKPFFWTLDQTTPRHGDRPFEIVHIDHTEVDQEFLCSHTDRNLGRAWATIMTDAYSRRFLATYVTFDPPSYRSCMMIARECVRRYGRLPQTVVVDGGLEFGSTYFETLLARYECTKKTRPPAESRFGSVCERLFGTLNTRFIHNLQGNTQIMQNVRQVTKAVNPKNQAIWTLDRFYARFNEFIYEVYDTTSHPALGCTPREMFALGMRQGGIRSHRLITYNEDFLMFTLPTTSKGTAKVSPGQGVKINNLYYWSESFRDPQIELSSVEVRFDPFDAGTAYAFVHGVWVRCYSQYHSIFQNRSEREIRFATEELRRRRKLHSQQFNVTAKKLAEFLESVEAEEMLLMQRLRDRESQDASSKICNRNGCSALSDTSGARPNVVTSDKDDDKSDGSNCGNVPTDDYDSDEITTYGRF